MDGCLRDGLPAIPNLATLRVLYNDLRNTTPGESYANSTDG
jgi:hypothetical protein